LPDFARRRALLALAVGLVLPLPGCGWEPLYADPQSGPASADLRAIQVMPIAERIGQRLEMELRNSLNPTGVPTAFRYSLHTTLVVALSDIGLQSQGTSTLGRLDVYAYYNLVDNRNGSSLLNNSLHVQNSFALNPNQYSTVVGEDDARIRSVAELSREMMTRLTLFMERRVAQNPPKPG
jgi:LPS-assembly lipoprotein